MIDEKELRFIIEGWKKGQILNEKSKGIIIALAEAYLEMSKEMPTVPELKWTALEDDDGVGMYFHGVSEIEEYSEACALSALKQKREWRNEIC